MSRHWDLGTQRQRVHVGRQSRLGAESSSRAVPPAAPRPSASSTTSENSARFSGVGEEQPIVPRSTTAHSRRGSGFRRRCAIRRATDTPPAGRLTKPYHGVQLPIHCPVSCSVKNAARTTRRSPGMYSRARTRRSDVKPEIDDGARDAVRPGAGRSSSAGARASDPARRAASGRSRACARTTSAGRRPGIGDVGEHRAGVPRPEAFDPRHHELRLAQRQAVVVDELAVAGNRRPWRHVAGDAPPRGSSGPQPGLLVGRERKRRPVLDVAHHAVLVQDPHDLAVEQHRRRQRFVREHRARPADASTSRARGRRRQIATPALRSFMRRGWRTRLVLLRDPATVERERERVAACRCAGTASRRGSGPASASGLRT